MAELRLDILSSGYESRYEILAWPDSPYVKFLGVVFNEGKDGLRIVDQSVGTITIRFPGGKHWSGTYRPWNYHPVCYRVYGILSRIRREGGEDLLMVRELAEIPAAHPPTCPYKSQAEIS